MQNTMSQIIETGSALGGRVTLKLNGNQELLDVAIADDLAGKKDELIRGFKDAHADAVKKLHRAMAVKLKDMGGLDALKNLGS